MPWWLLIIRLVEGGDVATEAVFNLYRNTSSAERNLPLGWKSLSGQNS
jgi:hypothetical protein